MSTEPVKTTKRGRLLVGAAIIVAIGGMVVFHGITTRAHTLHNLTQWTNDQAIPSVTLATIERATATESLTLPGAVQPYNKALINARVSGYLKSWKQDIGAQVQAGQELATIETPDLDQQFDQAKADLATAVANEQLSALTAKRWRALLASQSVSQQAADEKIGDATAKRTIVDAAQANVRRLQAMEDFKTLTAPFAGTVTARNVDIGALINAGSSAGQDLFELSDLHEVRIYVQVPQSFSARLMSGMKATFEVPQYPGETFTATLVASSQAVNMNSRSMLVQLQADNPSGKLAAGNYADVTFQVPADANALRVPATALVVGLHGTQVAVLGADNNVSLKSVQLGRDLGDSVEVLAGLSASDRVIDSPPETLQAGDSVRLTAAALSARPRQEASATPPVKVD